MKIRNVEFVGSFGHPHPLPRDPRPEVAIFGRSNVGKSSLINTLLGQRGVARISKTPGKTRSANYFLINDRFLFVDMPGYGYARVPKSELARWKTLYEQYIADAHRNNVLVQLIDARRAPTESDVESVERLARSRRPLCLVFNKADKVKPAAARAGVAEALHRLDAPRDAAVVAFSSVTGAGRRELWAWIEDALSL
ncbi:MAG: ribosome biogenesis GTP-binding protein YihA/YsxC [Candidatus Krumholzibacteria bacterium]|nr:ribosome biogenesis GTP-binding protein YihA/YsxC [Candidatus Krumholzibacteria bacterium]